MRAKPENEITLDRAAALTCLAAAAAFSYGTRILMLCLLAAGVSMLTELICLYARRIPFRFRHLDAAVTGVVLVMMMPPAVPVSLLIMSCIFAIIIGRALFGGKDNPVIPAASAGYCFALLNQRLQMTSFPAEFGRVRLLHIDRSLLTSGVSEHWNAAGDFTADINDWLTGLPGQPIGTGSLLLLAVIALVLIFRRSASGWVILPMMLMLIAGNIALRYFRDPALTAAAVCLTNQTLFAVIFLYGDPAIAPPHITGMFFGVLSAGCMLLIGAFYHIYDLPVLLSVFTAPAAAALREMMQQSESADPKGGKRGKQSAAKKSGAA